MNRTSLVFLMSATLLAQGPPNGDAIMKRMAEAAEKRQNVAYVLAISAEATQDGKTITAPGVVPAVAISQANPGKLRLEYGTTLSVTDGNATWLYDSSTKQYSKTAAAERLNVLGLPPLTTILPGAPIADILGSPTIIREETLNTSGEKRDCWVIQHTIKIPEAAATLVKTATISSWIDKEKSVALRHVVVLSMASTPPREITATVTVRSLAFDAALPADKFTFAPPPDSREVQTPVSELNLVGTMAPKFNIRDLSGATYSLDSLKGKTVLLDFWYTTCGPCIESAPVIEKLHSDLGDKGLVILGVDGIGEDQKVIEAYLKPRPAPYPIVLGSNYNMSSTFQVHGYPTFIVIGGDGKIVAHQVGYGGEARLTSMVTNAVLGLPDTGTNTSVPATSSAAAAAYSPSAVGTDEAGNLYLTDTGGRRVLKIPRDGPPVVVAGNGAQSPAGDGGPAILASLNEPSVISMSAAGNLYIADNGNKHIRKVRPDGTIVAMEIAELDRVGGMTIDSAGVLYFSEPNRHRVRKIAPDEKTVTVVSGTGAIGIRGDGGPATAALLMSPMGLALDSRGNLYIADPAAGRVRKVSADGTIFLAAGNGSSGYSGDGGLAVLAQLKEPLALAVDAAGNLFISGASDFRIRKVAPDGTIQTAFGSGTAGYSGDGGNASKAQFGRVPSLAFDSSGTLYLADPSNRRVRKIDASGIISTVSGSSGIE